MGEIRREMRERVRREIGDILVFLREIERER